MWHTVKTVRERGEQQTARAAFDAALAPECGAIRLEAEAILKRSSDPAAIWRVHDYLSEKRREIDRKYDFRYSVLVRVLGHLLAEGWVKEAEIAKLRPEKIEQITRRRSMPDRRFERQRGDANTPRLTSRPSPARPLRRPLPP